MAWVVPGSPKRIAMTWWPESMQQLRAVLCGPINHDKGVTGFFSIFWSHYAHVFWTSPTDFLYILVRHCTAQSQMFITEAKLCAKPLEGFSIVDIINTIRCSVKTQGSIPIQVYILCAEIACPQDQSRRRTIATIAAVAGNLELYYGCPILKTDECTDLLHGKCFCFLVLELLEINVNPHIWQESHERCTTQAKYDYD